MEPIIGLIVALATGAAVLLVVVGVFGTSRSAASQRLDQLVTVPQAQMAPEERATMREALAQSPLISGVNRIVERRSWSERLGRDLASADLTLRPLEYIVIRVLVIIGV